MASGHKSLQLFQIACRYLIVTEIKGRDTHTCRQSNLIRIPFFEVRNPKINVLHYYVRVLIGLLFLYFATAEPIWSIIIIP